MIDGEKLIDEMWEAAPHIPERVLALIIANPTEYMRSRSGDIIPHEIEPDTADWMEHLFRVLLQHHREVNGV